jgi:hypothetical protein
MYLRPNYIGTIGQHMVMYPESDYTGNWPTYDHVSRIRFYFADMNDQNKIFSIRQLKQPAMVER